MELPTERWLRRIVERLDHEYDRLGSRRDQEAREAQAEIGKAINRLNTAITWLEKDK